MRRRSWRMWVGLLGAVGCSATEPAPEDPPLTPTQQRTVQLNILYVHGVESCPEGRMTRAGNSLDGLEAAIQAELPARIAGYEADHPGVKVMVRSARANLYTAEESPFNPLDSAGPLNMDDWEVGAAACGATQQGEQCTTAYEWRYRLAREIEEEFPEDAKNILLVGHSTGARVAFEVAADVGPGGVGTGDWGVGERIAGVVSIQGMLDALNPSKYNFLGSFSFVNGCKRGELASTVIGGCAHGHGWCEYAGNVSGFAAADWVARNKRALMLTSWASCTSALTPELWTGRSDQFLPFDAQGSEYAVGLDLTPAPGETWRPEHGVRYGEFCHSEITGAASAQAVLEARNNILEWLLGSAPAVSETGSVDTSGSLAFGESTTQAVGTGCPAGEVDAGLEVVGVCKHPGFFDGGDHPIDAAELTVTNGPNCTGEFTWTQNHDRDNRHAATFYWKTHSLPPGESLVGTLPAD